MAPFQVQPSLVAEGDHDDPTEEGRAERKGNTCDEQVTLVCHNESGNLSYKEQANDYRCVPVQVGGDVNGWCKWEEMCIS